MMELEILSRRAISHPIHRLPEELLEHLFHLLLESADEEYALAWYEAFPLNLTQVCREWKALVLSRRNRRLWSTVRIDPADPDWAASRISSPVLRRGPQNSHYRNDARYRGRARCALPTYSFLPSRRNNVSNLGVNYLRTRYNSAGNQGSVWEKALFHSTFKLRHSLAFRPSHTGLASSPSTISPIANAPNKH